VLASAERAPRPTWPESLTVYCEILHLPASAPGDRRRPIAEDIGFIDCRSGWRSAGALQDLSANCSNSARPAPSGPNAAYDISVILAQVRAFAVLPVEDLILTHLTRKAAGENFGTWYWRNHPIRYLSTGQNIREISAPPPPKPSWPANFPGRNDGRRTDSSSDDSMLFLTFLPTPDQRKDCCVASCFPPPTASPSRPPVPEFLKIFPSILKSVQLLKRPFFLTGIST